MARAERTVLNNAVVIADPKPSLLTLRPTFLSAIHILRPTAS